MGGESPDFSSIPIPEEVRRAVDEILKGNGAREELMRIGILKLMQTKGGKIRLSSNRSKEKKKGKLGFRFNPVKFVLERGSDWEIFRLLVVAGLKDHRFVKDYVRKLYEMQNYDGGVPKAKGQPSSVLRTLAILQCLFQLNVNADSPPISKAVDFLWTKQRSDGSWCESSEITIPKWMTFLSNKYGMPYITGQIVQMLHDLGYGKDSRIDKAIQYIKNTQLPNGHWPAHDDQKHGDPDASCVPALVKVGESNSLIVKKGIDAMLRLLSEEKVEDANEAYHLWKVWPSLVEANYEFEPEILRKRLKRLKEIQREDGGWRHYWTQESVPTSSILVYLVEAGIISKTDLKEAIQLLKLPPGK